MVLYLPSTIASVKKLRPTITLIITIMTLISVAAVYPATVSALDKIDTSNYHASPSISQLTRDIAEDTAFPVSDKTPTTQKALGSLSARPTNNIVNTISFYDVVFVTATSGTIKTIQVAFPAGTTIPSNAFFNKAEGIGPGTASKSGLTITYTVTNAVNVPAGAMIRLEFANINNPLNPSANYKVTVTTRDAADTIIDGPSQSIAYAIKQIGTNAIANGAITGNKISGINKLIFGSCLGSIPNLWPGGFSQFFCNDPNASFGDMIVSSWSSPRSLPAPVLMNSVVGSSQVGFGFENQHSFVTSSQIVGISYIIFKKL